MEYVGWIEEILELNYQSHCCIILLCLWIPAKLVLGNTKMIQEKYGFAVGNFVRTMPPGPDSFTFAMQSAKYFFQMISSSLKLIAEIEKSYVAPT